MNTAQMKWMKMVKKKRNTVRKIKRIKMKTTAKKMKA